MHVVKVTAACAVVPARAAVLGASPPLSSESAADTPAPDRVGRPSGASVLPDRP